MWKVVVVVAVVVLERACPVVAAAAFVVAVQVADEKVVAVEKRQERHVPNFDARLRPETPKCAKQDTDSTWQNETLPTADGSVDWVHSYGPERSSAAWLVAGVVP